MTVYIILLTAIAASGYYLFEYKGYGGCRLLGNCSKKQKAFTAGYLTAAYLLFTLMASLRYGIGFDYYTYRDFYEYIGITRIQDLLHFYGYESFFYFFTKLCTALSLSYTAFLAIVSLWIHAVSMRFIYRFSKMPWVSVYLYVTFQFLAHNMNLLRQSIAVSFFLLAYPFLVKRRFGWYLLFMIIGGLFHNSLLLIIPIYFLLPLQNSNKKMKFTALFFAAVYFLSDPLISLLTPFLPAQYTRYLSESIYWQGSSFSYTILPAVYFILVLLFRKRLQQKPAAELQGNWICSDIAVNSAFFTFIICFFITRHFILERFSVYPFILSLLIIPEIINSYQNSEPSEKRKRLQVLILFLSFATLYFIFAAIKGFHHVYPYVSLFRRAISVSD